MDVRFCEGRNHRREAHVRAAGSARVRHARSSEARLMRKLFLLDKDLHGSRQTGERRDKPACWCVQRKAGAFSEDNLARVEARAL